MSTKLPEVGRRRQTIAEEALDANALELFARIAQAGSFAQAARDLGLPGVNYLELPASTILSGAGGC